MRNLRELDRYRLVPVEETMHPASEGAFQVPYAGVVLRVIAAAADDWDHVSVSTPGRCPTWDEMEHIKRMFFKKTETAMQLHLPPSEHINVHPYVLHVWRPHKQIIPLPPSIMV